MSDDTIVAVATAPGVAGIAVVRLSGAGVLDVASKVVRLRKHGSIRTLKPWRVALADAVDPETGLPFDEVLVIFMRGPKSYTGEDVVEIQCHGGLAASERIVEIALDGGARLAEPGEFTMRAYLNGRITLDQAEAVLDLVNATSKESLRQAGLRLTGGLARMVQTWEEGLYDALSDLQGSMDFPDDVVEAVDAVRQKLGSVRDSIADSLAHAPLGLALSEGVRVCIVGRPNAGKSSLFNALLGEDRAIVTEYAGTTRDVLRERAVWHGVPVIVLDTAGLRETGDVVESIGVERAKEAAFSSEVIVYVLDDSDGIKPEDAEWLSRLRDRRLLAAVSKCDLGKSLISSDELYKLGTRDVVRVSSVTGDGIATLKRKIVSFFIEENVPGSVLPGSQRQVECLRAAKNKLDEAIELLDQGWTLDVIALVVEEAAANVSSITGRKVSEETVAGIFAKFCVGK